ncbi:hypothetical protein C8Q75DRAFT_806268 [Abortiporus biennis]|nr:hypothetical protein C8Q75DRAFT_806268 [Abortiporus biennis]
MSNTTSSTVTTAQQVSMPSNSSATTTAPVPRPLQLVVDGNTSSPQLSSPMSSSSSSSRQHHSAPLFPPPSAKRLMSANPRRQSSISYYSSDHTRPTVDSRPPSSPSVSAYRPTSRRTNSMYIKAGEPFSPVTKKGNRRSLGFETSGGNISSPLSPGPSVDHGPLTLTEKHADLLRFIAQKESKCLELRSQLSVHEAELAQLKRKWERIVSRGMDRAYHTPSTPSSSTPMSPPSNGAVLDGIKEGVQGVGRLLAAGLDMAATSTVGSSPPSGPSRPAGIASSPPALRNARHVNTQSVSSVSTSTTTTSVSTIASARLSQSSASSLSLIEDEEGDKSVEEPTEEHQSIHRQSVTSVSTTEQLGTKVTTSDVLISPSSDNKSSKMLRRRSREAPKSPPSFTTVLESSSSSTEFGSVYPSPISSPSNLTTPVSSKRMSLPVKPNRNSMGNSASTLPGLAAVQPVSAWMGSVGKKWEEIQKGETFTKSQKRASILLSDVSQSIFSVLASPTTPQTPSSSSSTHFHHHNSSPSPAGVSVSSNPFLATLSPLSSSPAPTPSPLGSTVSLLEDSDEDEMSGNKLNGKGLGDVLVPTSVSPSKGAGIEGVKKSLIDDDDEDWNW